ncbi:MAG: hypothetical protein QXL82_01270 [Candidatus Aenigmatarchaeota archaeon]
MKVYVLEKKNLKKVEEILTKNEKTSMLSIYFRDFKTLGLEEDKVALILDGLEEYIKIADDLIKDFVEVPDESLKNEILKRFEEEEKKAREGFGFLFS